MDWAISEVLSKASSSARETLGIHDDLEKLRLTLPKVNALMDQAEWWRFVNADVATLFTELKGAKYDAEDLLDEFHYQELQKKIKGSEGSSQVGQVINWASSFVREAAFNFIKGVISGKSNVVQDIQEKLELVAGNLRQTIELLDPKRPEIIKRMSARRKTSSIVIESEVFGRDKEKEIVINILLQLENGSVSRSDDHGYGCSSLPNKRRKKENVSVLPIVGIGGLGKTTLAQLVYNDPRVKGYFQLKLWVCVRDQFDVNKILKMIVKSFTKAKGELLHMVLKKKVLTKKFLLVLDDVWCEDRQDWQKLYSHMSRGVKGSMILVTTRSPVFARITGSENPILLKGLPEEPFWNFFKRCAFGSEEPEEYPYLINVAKKNVTKLQGSPLAAKSLGALLSTELDSEHWKNIMNSEMWQFDQGDNGIIPALLLSYQYLSVELRRCFSFCCMFPKDYGFDKNRMVAKWVAHGYISPQGDEMLEERGAKCFDELVSRSFFQLGPSNDGMYLIHDLMYDLVKFVSSDECFYIQASESQQKVPGSIRHLSIERNLIEVIKSGKYSKLWSLQFPSPANHHSGELKSYSNFLFSQLTHLRMLDLCNCGINELSDSLGNMKHLRYLDLSHNKI
ncbi:Disease resistance protein RGA2 [Rhynchospora pubera]|uniref:Disease resistance protein RGA2 n=1 Tax=Rhynchospora pubera TaxID=906938 RepID=A0AAV8BXS3_9POAL|nr:Disease resistance protein RGA2 [Rhynchospora pubera]